MPWSLSVALAVNNIHEGMVNRYTEQEKRR